ncbi:MAG: hypothetical protein B7Z08_03950 [Sphingomonadales bacterium 32-68-7]|nr:MAG: hypothetical protein B7Z33_13865 [Sphingomonadales bacterium 12-68-11]OYX09690.1 MAG: hypothetical protein B7Z08_03950 [Sphingomonadales bacterium 32-68-7]
MFRLNDPCVDDCCHADGEIAVSADALPERAISHTCPVCGFVNWCVYDQGHSGLCLCDKGHHWQGSH